MNNGAQCQEVPPGYGRGLALFGLSVLLAALTSLKKRKPTPGKSRYWTSAAFLVGLLIGLSVSAFRAAEELRIV
jgi:hypothetical protein